MSLSSEQATNGRPDADLKDRYRRVRQQSLYLCESLQTEDFVAQSMPDVSPTKWHLAHTTWFFETFVLCEHAPGYRRFDARFNYLFNSYYEAAGPRHPRAEPGEETSTSPDAMARTTGSGPGRPRPIGSRFTT